MKISGSANSGLGPITHTVLIAERKQLWVLGKIYQVVYLIRDRIAECKFPYYTDTTVGLMSRGFRMIAVMWKEETGTIFCVLLFYLADVNFAQIMQI